jgi:hypothetical protein
MAAHENPRTTKFYDRTGDQITLDEVELYRDLKRAVKPWDNVRNNREKSDRQISRFVNLTSSN